MDKESGQTSPDWYQPTAEDVVAARKSLGLTQSRAGAVICSSLRAWQQWENGKRNMPPNTWRLFQLETAHLPRLVDPASKLGTPTKPSSADVATACKELDIYVGDTILRRVTSNNGQWEELMLTLLWLGTSQAVWRMQSRRSDKPNWGTAQEITGVVLNEDFWQKILK